MRAFHKNPDRLYTELSHVITLKAHTAKKVVCFCRLLKYLKPLLNNSVYPDQTGAD